jgi:hypothetical protein
MIELMIDQNGGLDSNYNQVIRLANPMYAYVLNPPICHSQFSFVVRHCTFRPTCSVLVEPIYVVGALNMYYYLVLLYVYPITYPVMYLVYVVHVLYCTVVGFQYLKEHDLYQDIHVLLIFQIVPEPKKQRDLEGACGACAPPKIRKAYVMQR